MVQSRPIRGMMVQSTPIGGMTVKVCRGSLSLTYRSEHTCPRFHALDVVVRVSLYPTTIVPTLVHQTIATPRHTAPASITKIFQSRMTVWRKELAEFNGSRKPNKTQRQEPPSPRISDTKNDAQHQVDEECSRLRPTSVTD